MIISRRAQNVGAVERRHCLLLFRTDDENRVVESAHDVVGAEEDGESARSAGRFRMHGRNSAQFLVDLGYKCAEMKLFGKLAGVEISDRRGARFPPDRFLHHQGLCDRIP